MQLKATESLLTHAREEVETLKQQQQVNPVFLVNGNNENSADSSKVFSFEVPQQRLQIGDYP